jgi:hypothetical protein
LTDTFTRWRLEPKDPAYARGELSSTRNWGAKDVTRGVVPVMRACSIILFNPSYRSCPIVPTGAVMSNRAAARGVTTRQAIVTGWLLCGVLDITAACIQARVEAGRSPWAVLKGVASALWGRAALSGGAGMAAIGLAMHFTVALTATLVFYALSRRIAFLRTASLWIVGPFYGVIVFCAMNYGTLPLLSWLRSLYLGTPPRWPGSMSWPQLGIHMICVGLPIVWGVRRAVIRPARG